MTGAADLVVTGRRVVTPSGAGPAAIVIAGGIIRAVLPPAQAPAGAPAADAGSATVLPGLVDTHVHINDPGRADWEGIETASRAAAAGGVTALLEMPLNSIPATTSVAALEAKRRAVQGRTAVDLGFLGGAVPGNQDDLEPLAAAGIFAFKCFLVDSGVPEFPPLDEAGLRAALPVLARLDLPLLVHAELPGPIAAARAGLAGADPRRYATWLASRPAAAETAAIGLVTRLAGEAGARVHVVHVSSGAGAAAIAEARARGVRVTAETCPHYLGFAAEEIPDGATEYKCAPPIREAVEREALWAALEQGALDLIASDHSPAPPALKARESGSVLDAWGGIASLQVTLPAVWTGARARGFGIERVVRWMCAAPARLAGLAGRKGAIAPGCDADLVFFDESGTTEVTGASLRHRHRLSPWTGRRLSGAVRRTYLRGVPVYDAGAPDGPPCGRLLTRS